MKLLLIAQSVLAALFGVQSQSKYQYDFNSSSFWPFIIIGIIFVAGFILTIVFVVDAVLP